MPQKNRLSFEEIDQIIRGFVASGGKLRIEAGSIEVNHPEGSEHPSIKGLQQAWFQDRQSTTSQIQSILKSSIQKEVKEEPSSNPIPPKFQIPETPPEIPYEKLHAGNSLYGKTGIEMPLMRSVLGSQFKKAEDYFKQFDKLKAQMERIQAEIKSKSKKLKEMDKNDPQRYSLIESYNETVSENNYLAPIFTKKGEEATSFFKHLSALQEKSKTQRELVDYEKSKEETLPWLGRKFGNIVEMMGWGPEVKESIVEKADEINRMLREFGTGYKAYHHTATTEPLHTVKPGQTYINPRGDPRQDPTSPKFSKPSKLGMLSPLHPYRILEKALSFREESLKKSIPVTLLDRDPRGARKLTQEEIRSGKARYGGGQTFSGVLGLLTNPKTFINLGSAKSIQQDVDKSDAEKKHGPDYFKTEDWRLYDHFFQVAGSFAGMLTTEGVTRYLLRKGGAGKQLARGLSVSMTIDLISEGQHAELINKHGGIEKFNEKFGPLMSLIPQAQVAKAAAVGSVGTEVLIDRAIQFSLWDKALGGSLSRLGKIVGSSATRKEAIKNISKTHNRGLLRMLSRLPSKMLGPFNLVLLAILGGGVEILGSKLADEGWNAYQRRYLKLMKDTESIWTRWKEVREQAAKGNRAKAWAAIPEKDKREMFSEGILGATPLVGMKALGMAIGKLYKENPERFIEAYNKSRDDKDKNYLQIMKALASEKGFTNKMHLTYDQNKYGYWYVDPISGEWVRREDTDIEGVTKVELEDGKVYPEKNLDPLNFQPFNEELGANKKIERFYGKPQNILEGIRRKKDTSEGQAIIKELSGLSPYFNEYFNRDSSSYTVDKRSLNPFQNRIEEMYYKGELLPHEPADLLLDFLSRKEALSRKGHSFKPRTDKERAAAEAEAEGGPYYFQEPDLPPGFGVNSREPFGTIVPEPVGVMSYRGDTKAASKRGLIRKPFDKMVSNPMRQDTTVEDVISKYDSEGGATEGKSTIDNYIKLKLKEIVLDNIIRNKKSRQMDLDVRQELDLEISNSIQRRKEASPDKVLTKKDIAKELLSNTKKSIGTLETDHRTYIRNRIEQGDLSESEARLSEDQLVARMEIQFPTVNSLIRNNKQLRMYLNMKEAEHEVGLTKYVGLALYGDRGKVPKNVMRHLKGKYHAQVLKRKVSLKKHYPFLSNSAEEIFKASIPKEETLFQSIERMLTDTDFEPSKIGRIPRLLHQDEGQGIWAEARRIIFDNSKDRVVNASKTARLMYMVRSNLVTAKEQELLDRASVVMDEVFYAGHPTNPRKPSLWIKENGEVDLDAMLKDKEMIERELDTNPKVMEAYTMQLELLNALGNEYKRSSAAIGIPVKDFDNPYWFPRFSAKSNDSISLFKKFRAVTGKASFEKYRSGGKDRTFDWHENMSRHINHIQNLTSHNRAVKDLIETYGREIKSNETEMTRGLTTIKDKEFKVEWVPFKVSDTHIGLNYDAMLEDAVVDSFEGDPFIVKDSSLKDAVVNPTKSIGPSLKLDKDGNIWMPKKISQAYSYIKPEAANNPTTFKIFKNIWIKGLASWKIYQLVSPQRFVDHNIRNALSDLDVVLANNPDTLRWIPQASKDLFRYLYQDRGINDTRIGEFEAGKYFLSRNGQTTYSQSEFGIDLVKSFETISAPSQHQGVMKALSLTGKTVTKPVAKVWSAYWGEAIKLRDFREQVLRYAAFLSFLNQMKKNKSNLPNWFASSSRWEIQNLKNPMDRAYLLSNDMIGNYDRLGRTNRWLRSNLIPFHSFTAINFTRVQRSLRNLIHPVDHSGDQLAVKTGRNLINETIRRHDIPSLRPHLLLLRGALGSASIARKAFMFYAGAHSLKWATDYYNWYMFPEAYEEEKRLDPNHPPLIITAERTSTRPTSPEDRDARIIKDISSYWDLPRWWGGHIPDLFPEMHSLIEKFAKGDIKIGDAILNMTLDHASWDAIGDYILHYPKGVLEDTEAGKDMRIALENRFFKGTDRLFGGIHPLVQLLVMWNRLPIARSLFPSISSGMPQFDVLKWIAGQFAFNSVYNTKTVQRILDKFLPEEGYSSFKYDPRQLWSRRNLRRLGYNVPPVGITGGKLFQSFSDWDLKMHDEKTIKEYGLETFTEKEKKDLQGDLNFNANGEDAHNYIAPLEILAKRIAEKELKDYGIPSKIREFKTLPDMLAIIEDFRKEHPKLLESFYDDFRWGGSWGSFGERFYYTHRDTVQDKFGRQMNPTWTLDSKNSGSVYFHRMLRAKRFREEGWEKEFAANLGAWMTSNFLGEQGWLDKTFGSMNLTGGKKLSDRGPNLQRKLRDLLTDPKTKLQTRREIDRFILQQTDGKVKGIMAVDHFNLDFISRFVRDSEKKIRDAVVRLHPDSFGQDPSVMQWLGSYGHELFRRVGTRLDRYKKTGDNPFPINRKELDHVLNNLKDVSLYMEPSSRIGEGLKHKPVFYNKKVIEDKLAPLLKKFTDEELYRRSRALLYWESLVGDADEYFGVSDEVIYGRMPPEERGIEALKRYRTSRKGPRLNKAQWKYLKNHFIIQKRTGNRVEKSMFMLRLEHWDAINPPKW